jgi:glycosyltransferase involved in cell wall biosynthesis
VRAEAAAYQKSGNGALLNMNNRRIAVVTPTFQRPALLQRFISRLRKQRYRDWVSVIVHDGPGEAYDALAGKFADDPRFHFLQTEERANDCGNTPRREGAQHVARTLPDVDYVVFWDDDNYFYLDALEKIAGSDVPSGTDLFLVGVEYRKDILPPRGVSAHALQAGQVDTANFVARPALAAEAYAAFVEKSRDRSAVSLLVSDFQTFEIMRSRVDSIPTFPGAVVGFHDGLRWKPYIRHVLGIGPLNLASRPWVQWLTRGRYRQRPAGGLD